MFRGEFFDYDPLTGLTEYYEETPDGKIHIHTYQDVEPFLDAAKRIANAGTADEAWTKQGVAMYASVPPIVIGQLMKRGINIWDQNDLPRVVQEINQNYPYCKTTYKTHEIR